MNVTLEMIDDHIFATCKVCGEPICLNVTQSGPMWELTNPDVGEETQFGIRMDCAKTGCDPVHVDDGRIMVTRNAHEADEMERYGIAGHGAVAVTRVVKLPEWEVLDEKKPA